jgi:signal transduction histidine kinase/CheY-like chemotaxis protein
MSKRVPNFGLCVDGMAPALRYLIAFAIFVFAVGLRLLVAPVEAGLPFITFYPASVLVVLLCGLGPGILTVILSTLAADWLFLPLHYSLVPAPAQLPVLATFVLSEILVCTIVNQMHRTRRDLCRVMATLETAEARFRLAQEMSLDAFVILEAIRDGSGRITDFRWLYANPAALRGLGVSEADLARTVAEVAPSAALPGGWIERHAAVVESGRPAEFELECQTGEAPRWFRNVVVKVGDGVAVTYAEITHEKLARDRLRESERNFQLAMSVSRSLAFRVDRDYRYTWAYSCRSDFNSETLVGRSNLEVFAPATAEKLDGLFRRVWANGQGVRRDVTVRSGFATAEQHFDLILEPVLDAEGTVEALAGAAYEITEQVRARLAAERANEAKSRFLAATSHDLRQPIQGQRLLLHILAGKPLDEASSRVVQTMSETLDSTERLLARLMEFAALESGKVTPSRQPTALAPLVRRIVEGELPEARRKGLRLRAQVWDCVVDTDPVLLERILRNLVANAVRHTRRGGVLVGLRRRPGGRVAVAVHDSGYGVPAAMQSEIFEEFHQLGGAERGKGLGLGLAIVARTAELLGHRLNLRSQEGRGAAFSVELSLLDRPDQRASADLPALMPASGPAARKANLLLVEDDVLQARGLAMILEEAGFTVMGAPDAASALAQVRVPGPDLLLTDYRLPQGVSGLDIIRMIRRRFERFIPAILITGDTHTAILEEAAAEACLVMHKPYQPEALIEAIRGQLAQARSVRGPHTRRH